MEPRDTQQRRFHSDKDSEYPLPNDEREHLRLDAQHNALLAMMHNQPFHATVDASKVNIAVDIGCGTGRMTLLIAQRFPNAQVYGIDLSPIPPSARESAEGLNLSDRIHWLQGNIFDIVASHPDIRLGVADYVYHRFLVAGMKSYDEYLRDAVRPLLKSGGWVEMHYLPGLTWFDSTNKPVSLDWTWTKVVNASMRSKGMEGAFAYLHIHGTLQMLDFDCVASKLYKLPFTPVPGKPEMDPFAGYAVSGLKDAFQGIVARLLLSTELADQEEGLKEEVAKTLGQPREGMWFPMIVAWAQKPATSA